MRLSGERSEDATVVWTFSSCESARIDGAGLVVWETEGVLFIFFSVGYAKWRQVKVFPLMTHYYAPSSAKTPSLKDIKLFTSYSQNCSQ